VNGSKSVSTDSIADRSYECIDQAELNRSLIKQVEQVIDQAELNRSLIKQS